MLISAVLFILAFQDCKSQTAVKIPKPELEVQGNRVKITYDINDSKPNDKFIVWIEILDANGRSIDPKSITGDIGKQIKGGKDKEISWDSEADGIVPSEGMSIQIYAELISPSKTELSEGFAITVNETDFTNISGGKGIFGSFIKQNFSIKFKHDYIRSFGYTPGLTE